MTRPQRRGARRSRRARPSRPRVRGAHRAATGAGRGRQRRGRTIAYLDCMRDLDVTLGPAVLDELRSSLPVVLHASRWWCGRVFDRGAELLDRIARGLRARSRRCSGELMGAGFGLWDQMGEEQRVLRRRWASVVAGEANAVDAFADWTPAWHGSNYHSADLQIAAASTDAVARGDFLVVLGDFHGGGNPLAQGLFGLRHPDPAAMMRRVAADAGPGVHLSPPRRGVVEMTARSWPMYPEGDIVVMSGDEPAPAGTSRVALADVVVDDGHVSDRAGTFRVRLAQFLYLPIFVASLRSFDPIGEHDGRAQIGRLVVRRAQRSARAAELPASPTTSRPGPATAASRAASSPVRRSSASRGMSTSRAPPYAGRSSASSRPPASRRPAHPSSSPRCFPARRIAGCRPTPDATRASCGSSRSTEYQGTDHRSSCDRLAGRVVSSGRLRTMAPCASSSPAARSGTRAVSPPSCPRRCASSWSRPTGR